ncbi:MAG: 4Fe-4S binding protein [Bacteroidales bacterium]|nr:4Fe-4S binding protein [Bacteroidales bacterium]
MNITYPIYTEKNNCQDCYKCIKVCPVKAIKFEDYSASITPERCIWCGACVEICPSNAKKVRNDVDTVIRALKNGEKIIVSLAPSYLSEFSDIQSDTLISLFKESGFFGVSETALGAELVALKAKEWFASRDNGVYFSSCCPTTVQLVRKYYPQYSENISPIASPVEAHATFLKQYYPDTKVCFVGPCIAKKTELNYLGNKLDYVLTFREIQELFETLGVDPEFQRPDENDKFIPMKAGIGNLYPSDGGMLKCMMDINNGMPDVKQYVSDNKLSATESEQKNRAFDDTAYDIQSIPNEFLTVSGVENVRAVLEDVDKFDKNKKYFIEILGCSGGCVMGPATIKKASALVKRTQVFDNITASEDNNAYKKLFNTNITADFTNITAFERKSYTQKDIIEILKRVNKVSEDDYLNCGGCGYDNCKAFGTALLDGLAENDMCVSYMRRLARDKTNILLKKMPQGVVIVDENLKIIQANEKFAITLGSEMEELYNIKPGLKGLDITKELSFHKYFSSVLNSCNDILEQDIRDGENFYRLSVFSVQDHQQVCGIIENMHAPEVRKDVVLTRTQDVIKQNMKVVQQIAFLLGENASYTESMLNSIVESHSDINDNDNEPITFDINV